MMFPARLPLIRSAHRLVEPDAWSEHIPFLNWLIEAQQPRLLVELGTHTGNSYCAACQTVATLGLSTRCWAVDSWRGDEQAGFYDASVYEELKAYHDPLYSVFSQLLRCTFDEALGSFGDESVDLLHIDGLHTYAAVKHDFESWLPKLAPGGVVLFHDTNERARGFEVWRLWAELAAEYPSFEFSHGHGLGVLMPKGRREFLAPLLDAKGTSQEAAAESFFASLGRNNTLQLAVKRQLRESEQLREEIGRHQDQAAQAHARADDVAREVKAMHEQHRAALSRSTSLTRQWKQSAEELRQELSATSHQIRSLEDQLQRSEDSIAHMQHAFEDARQRLLNGSALRNACLAIAQQVCRLYDATRWSLLGRLFVRNGEWDSVDTLMKQAAEHSSQGRNHQACGSYLAAARCGLLLLKKLRRHLLLRPVLRGHFLNALEQQFDAQWQFFVDAGQILPEATGAPRPEARFPAALFLDVAHYSRQANHPFADADAAFRHYSGEGWRRGLDPHPFFVTRQFIDRNQDAIDPAANPLTEYHRLLTAGRAPEAHGQFSGSWLRSYFWESSPADLREGRTEIPASPTESEPAKAFSKLPPKTVIGIILFQASDDEVSQMIRILDHAAEGAVATGFERPQLIFTDHSLEWNEDTLRARRTGEGSPIHFLPATENAGFGRGHNSLMSHAFEVLGATHYLCLNPDGYLHPDALAEMLQAALRQGQPALIEALQAPCEHPKEYDPITLETNWSTGGCLLIPRFLFELTGGFDPRFFLYCEDVDFSWTVWSHGYPCVVAPRALFHHRMMSRQHDPKVDQWYLESGRLLAAKWGNTRFRLLCEQYLIERRYYSSEATLPPVGEPSLLHPHVRVDFGNLFTFARARW